MDDGIVGIDLIMALPMAEQHCLDNVIVESTFGYSPDIISHIFLVQFAPIRCSSSKPKNVYPWKDFNDPNSVAFSIPKPCDPKSNILYW